MQTTNKDLEDMIALLWVTFVLLVSMLWVLKNQTSIFESDHSEQETCNQHRQKNPRQYLLWQNWTEKEKNDQWCYTFPVDWES